MAETVATLGRGEAPRAKETYQRLFNKYKALRPPKRPFKFIYVGDRSISEETDEGV